MNEREEFIGQVERALPPELKAYASEIPALVDHLTDSSIMVGYYQQHVRMVVQFLPKWVGRGSRTETMEGRPDAHRELTREYLVDALSVYVRSVRKAYFGGEGAPFASKSEAGAWISRVNREYLRQEALSEPRGEAKTYFDLMACMLEASDAGLPPFELLYYVLADVPPLTVPYEITFPGWDIAKEGRKCWGVILKINSELRFDDLVDIYNQVKRVLGVKKGKRFTENHLELYMIVKARGGVPDRDKGKFWQSVFEEWDARHPGRYKEGVCVKRAYERMIGKLKRMEGKS